MVCAPAPLELDRSARHLIDHTGRWRMPSSDGIELFNLGRVPTAIPVPRHQDPKSLDPGQPRLTAETVESPVRGNAHAGFGERPAETDRWRHRNRAAGRLNHPGAQLTLFDQDEGLRHQVFLTDTPYSGGGSAQFLEVRHRGHATVEDHIRCGKTTGFGRFPSRDFNVNAVWLELSLAAIDLLAWTRVLLLDGELAHCRAEEAPLPAAARRRPPHPRRPTPALADLGDLALETRTGRGLPSPRRTAPTRQLTGKPLTAHDPKDPGGPDHRAGYPPCPNTEIASATRQLSLNDAPSPQPKRRG